METLILGWYVMVHTGSVMLLTAFASLQFLGSLAAPMFGVLGDRLGGRVMLCAMRGAYLGLAILVMLLALVGWLTPAWVFVLGFSRASADSARVAGALAGAGLSTALGIGPAYLVVTAFYLTSLGLTFGVSQRPPMPDPGAPPRPAGVASLELPRPSRLRDLKD